MCIRILLSLLGALFFSLLSIGFVSNVSSANENQSQKRCGFSPFADLKYTKADRHFGHVNPNAPKGGRVRIARIGAFDSLNFLRYPGNTIEDRKQIPLEVTGYLFDSFLLKGADEATGYYCLAASEIKVSADYSKVKFVLNPKARWHDGQPITIDDVLFTFQTLKKQGAPYYRQVLRGVTARKAGNDGIVYTNSRSGNRDFVTIVGSLPIHPKHFWTQDKLHKKTMTLPLGSGPYRVLSAEAGSRAHLKRVKNYWAKDHFVNRGRYNFDDIIIDYYRDEVSTLSAFKVGSYDIRFERNALSWSKEYEGQALKTGKIKKISVPASHQGDIFLLTFNQRRALFQNQKVRQAFSLLYNFSSANRILFHNFYEPVGSLYGHSQLAAKGEASEAEVKLLHPFLSALPKDILKTDTPWWLQPGLQSRDKIRRASKLLDEAGLVVKDTKRIDPATGHPLKLSVSYLNPSHQRILLFYAQALRQVGIELSLPALEPFAARKQALDHDYDMILLKWTPEMLAGKSEKLLWGSRLADVKGSYAFGGVKNPVLDKVIETMHRAQNQEEMVVAAKVFDRVFRFASLAIPLWRREKNWISYWQSYHRPKIDPSSHFSIIDRWWYAPEQHSLSKK